MTSVAGRPWWRDRRIWVVPCLGTVALVIFLISLLPTAPVAPSTGALPDTAVGKLVEKIEQINFPTDKVGWALVAARPYWRLVRTVDGGVHWQDVNPAGDASNGGVVLTVMGAQAAAVVILPYEYIRDSGFAVTTDGGAQWTAGVLPNGASTGPDPIFALSNRVIFAVLGNGTVVSTSNGGTTWSPAKLLGQTSGSCLPTSVWFTSASSGWVSGSCTGVAALWHTANGGASWQPEVLSSSYSPSTAVSVAPPKEISSGGALTTVVADTGTGESVRVFENSSGDWRAAPAVTLPAGRVLVSFANKSDGWVLVEPRARGATALAYYTTTAGYDWSFRATPIPAPELTGIDLVSPLTVVALAQAGRYHLVWTTADGGVKWSSSEMAILNGPEPRVNGIRP
ncbi:MAG: WD40/YVTN/BNR-like repeat-containing protein [Candidatus Dormibacteria bacterium]